MPASQKKRLDSIQRLGIIAGGGEIPRQLIAACEEQGLDVFIVAFEGHTDPETIEGRDHIQARLGKVGGVLKALKDRQISDLVLIGKIRRPSLAELKPDLKAATFFATEGLSIAGDDGLLKALRRFLEKEGFHVHGAQDFMPDLLTPEGVLGRCAPSDTHNKDIARGVRVLQVLGPQDVGQAIVAQQGQVLGIEGAEGTDELIRRCGGLKRGGVGPVLVKLCKPGQDKDLDLPTIGPETLQNAADAGFAGVAVHAGHSFVHALDSVKDIADSHDMFVLGIKPEGVTHE